MPDTPPLLVELDLQDPRPLYVQIVDEVRRAIVIGVLAPGDALPSARQMAQMCRVNPLTVQQAYGALEREGLTFAQRGRGTYVAERTESKTDREKLLVQLAVQAQRDAARYGFSRSDLIGALNSLLDPHADAGSRASDQP